MRTPFIEPQATIVRLTATDILATSMGPFMAKDTLKPDEMFYNIEMAVDDLFSGDGGW